MTVITITGLLPASDTGTQGDTVTSAHSVEIIGSADPNSTVIIHDSGSGNASSLIVTNAEGIFTGYVPLGSVIGAAVPPGTHTEYVTELGSNRNIVATSANYVFTELAPLPIPTIALDPASDTGTLGDDRTADATMILTGRGVADTDVELFLGQTDVGEASVDSAGIWSVGAGGLTPVDGSYTFSAEQFGTHGETATSAPVTIVLDRSVPAAPSTLGITPSDTTGTTNAIVSNTALPTFVGLAIANSIVEIYDGASLIGRGTANEAGGYSILATTPLAHGSNSVIAFDVNGVGTSSSASPSLQVTYGEPPPAPGGLSLAPLSDSGVEGDDLTQVTSPTITGSSGGGNGDLIRLYDGSSLAGTGFVADGTWSVAVTAPLANGLHRITATETNPYEQVSGVSQELGITIDTTPPATLGPPVLDPGSDSGAKGDDITNVTSPVITGTGDADGDPVRLFDGSVLIGSGTVTGGGWSIMPLMPLAQGTHDLTATETDIVGNVSAASRTLALTIETSPPSTPGTPMLAPASDSGIPGDGITTITTPTITGAGDTDGDRVTLLDGPSVIGTGMVTGGTWSITPATPLSLGSHAVSATETDAASNVSAASTSLDITIVAGATAAPGSVRLDPASDSGAFGDTLTNATRPVIDGSGSINGDLVTLYDGTAVVGTATVADGAWSIAPTAALPDGVHDFSATETALGGFLSTLSAPLAITIDTETPATPSLSASTRSNLIARPTLQGAAPADTLVSLYDGTARIGSVTSGSDGSWSLTPATALSVGTHALTATATDQAGNVSAASAGIEMVVSSDASYDIVSEQSDGTHLIASYGVSGPLLEIDSTNGSVLLGESTITTLGNDTVSAGPGTTTIFAAGPTTIVNAGSGELYFVGGAGAATVTGGTGSSTIYGGSGGGYFSGGSGGGSLIVAGGGSTTMVLRAGSTGFGGSGPTTMFGADNAVLVGTDRGAAMVAGTASEALWAGDTTSALYAGTGDDTLVGGASGVATIIGGSGNDLIVGAAGHTVAYGGTGNDRFFAGSGAMQIVEGRGADQVMFGSGNATVTGGAGTDLYDLVQGQAGGLDLISNFKVGTDKIQLFGDDPTRIQVVTAGGDTSLTLSDGTRIILVGVGDIGQGSIV